MTIRRFVQGDEAKTIYEEAKRTIKTEIWYDDDLKIVKGSSAFIAARIDSIVRSLGQGIRVATLADLNDHRVMKLIRNSHYSDAPAIVFRSTKEDYNPNKEIIEELAPLVEQKMGKLRLPVLVTGFDVIPSGKNSYGLQIIPREDFSVLHDERLLGGHTGKRFSTVDKNGLPNFEENGTRTWHARDLGLSRVFINRNLDLNLNYSVGNLSRSGKDGRIILVSDSPVSAKKE